MKKLVHILIVISMIVACSATTLAVGMYTKLIEVNYTSVKSISLDGVNLKPNYDNEKPFLYNGRVFVPLRFISENMDKDVKWLDGNIDIKTKDTTLYEVYKDDYALCTSVYVKPRPDLGFNYGYYIIIPDNMDIEKTKHMLFEGCNFGFASEKVAPVLLSEHIYTYGGFQLSKELKIPYVVPVVPRVTRGTEAFVYTHDLGSATINISETSKMHRIDRQVVCMIQYSQRVLSEQFGIHVNSKVLMYGYSASAHFGDRISMLYPDIVSASCFGGYNSIPILPIKAIGDTVFDYPLGVNNYNKLTGTDFDLNKYTNISRMYFMGELDNNDNINALDCFNYYESSVIANKLGKDMIKERFAKTSEIISEVSPNTIFNMYSYAGHSGLSGQAFTDVLKFFRDFINK